MTSAEMVQYIQNYCDRCITVRSVEIYSNPFAFTKQLSVLYINNETGDTKIATGSFAVLVEAPNICMILDQIIRYILSDCTMQHVALKVKSTNSYKRGEDYL